MKHPNHSHIELQEMHYQGIENLLKLGEHYAKDGLVIEAIEITSDKLRRKIYSYRDALRKKGIHDYDDLIFSCLDKTKIRITSKDKKNNPNYDIPFIAHEPLTTML
jgi:hypothetical protein